MSKLKEENPYNFECHLLSENEQIELKITLSNLDPSISHPSAKLQFCLFSCEENEYQFLDETEILSGASNLDFSETLFLPCSYMWGKLHSLQLVDAAKHDNPIQLAKTTFSLGELVMAKNRKLAIRLVTHNNLIGELRIKWNIPKYGREYYEFNPSVSEIEQTGKVWLVKSVPLVYSYSISRLTATGEFATVYNSENKVAHKKINWKETIIPAITLCKNNLQQALCFTLKKNKKEKSEFYAQTYFSLNSILNSKTEYRLADSDMQAIKGKVDIKCKKIEIPYALELVNSGMKFKYIYGIDYTDSSLNDSEEGASLQELLNSKLSTYHDVIMEVSNILHSINPNNKFALYGFGRSLEQKKIENVSSSCFAVNEDQSNPWVDSYRNIGKIYSKSLSSVIRGGRSIFHKIMFRAVLAAQYIKLTKSDEYVIAVFFTDGKLQDLKHTLLCLKEAEDLPLSVILVGIGNGDFESLEILDGDEAMRKIEGRDFIKFIRYSQFGDSKNLLGYEMLRKLPQSIKDYFKNNPQSSGHHIKLPPEILKLSEDIFATYTDVYEIKKTLSNILEIKPESEPSNSTGHTQ